MLSFLDPFSGTMAAVLADSVIALMLLGFALLAYRQRRSDPLGGLIALGIATCALAVGVYLLRVWVNFVPEKDWQGNPVQFYELTNPHPDPLAAAAPWWMWAVFAVLAALTVTGFVVTIRRLVTAELTARRQSSRDDRAITQTRGGTGLSMNTATESSRDGNSRFGWIRWRQRLTGAGFGATPDDPWEQIAAAAARQGWKRAGQEVEPLRSGPWDLLRTRGNKVLLIRRADPAAGIGKSRFGDVWLIHNPGTAEIVIDHATGSDEVKFAQILTWVGEPADAPPRPEWESRRLVEAELPMSYARDTATHEDVDDWKRAWNAGVDALLQALDDLAKMHPNVTRHNKFQRYGTCTRNFGDRIEVRIGRVEGFDYCDGLLLVRDAATGMQLRCEYPDSLPTPAALTGLIRGQLEAQQQS